MKSFFLKMSVFENLKMKAKSRLFFKLFSLQKQKICFVYTIDTCVFESIASLIPLATNVKAIVKNIIANPGKIAR